MGIDIFLGNLSHIAEYSRDISALFHFIQKKGQGIVLCIQKRLVPAASPAKDSHLAGICVIPDLSPGFVGDLPQDPLHALPLICVDDQKRRARSDVVFQFFLYTSGIQHSVFIPSLRYSPSVMQRLSSLFTLF